MALHQDTFWEVRTAGSVDNGSGFHDRIPGTSVDYSRQNASQLSINDLVGSAASVTVTSAAAGFTNAMVGNVIRIRGGANFIVGFYEIVQFNAANSVNLDRIPCTGAGANGLAEVGGAQINCDLIDTVCVPGNTVYVKNGVYAAHPAVTFNAVYTKSLPLAIIGYNVARGDRPTGANRPQFQMGANSFGVTRASLIRNIRFQGSHATLLETVSGTPGYVLIENCYFQHTAVAATVVCVYATSNTIVIDCEFSGTPGATSYGIHQLVGINTTVINCYFYNLTHGIYSEVGGSAYANIFFNIFANISIAGVNLLANAIGGATIANNTFANIGRSGILSTSPTNIGVFVMNNTFSDCVTAGIEGIFAKAMYNNFFGCGATWIGGTLVAEDNNTFVAPQFVTPGSNYALQRTSGLIDRAFSMRLGV